MSMTQKTTLEKAREALKAVMEAKGLHASENTSLDIDATEAAVKDPETGWEEVKVTEVFTAQGGYFVSDCFDSWNVDIVMDLDGILRLIKAIAEA